MNDFAIVKSSMPPAELAASGADAAAYRAYMKGAYDAMRSRMREQDSSLKMAFAAMTFGFACWATLMYFVFKS